MKEQPRMYNPRVQEKMKGREELMGKGVRGEYIVGGRGGGGERERERGMYRRRGGGGLYRMRGYTEW
jgi:hypothetical protein